MPETPIVVTLTIPANHVLRVQAAFKGKHAIPQIPDTSWTPGQGQDEEDRPVIPKFTDRDWVNERIRRFVIVDVVAEWERRQAMPGLNPDDGVVRP